MPPAENVLQHQQPQPHQPEPHLQLHQQHCLLLYSALVLRTRLSLFSRKQYIYIYIYIFVHDNLGLCVCVCVSLLPSQFREAIIGAFDSCFWKSPLFYPNFPPIFPLIFFHIFKNSKHTGLFLHYPYFPPIFPLFSQKHHFQKHRWWPLWISLCVRKKKGYNVYFHVLQFLYIHVYAKKSNLYNFLGWGESTFVPSRL